MSERRLVIVEDDRDTRDLLEAVLAHPQVRIETAPDGSAAIETAWQLRPHAIVLDQKPIDESLRPAVLAALGVEEISPPHAADAAGPSA